MKIDQAILFLENLKQRNIESNVRIVVPFEDIKDCFEDMIAYPVLEKTAWNDQEVNFLELKPIYK